ncbi:MAG TPA: SDR family NAD(P)-dependent oxidoreductase [Solirubrobacteraceae bacterium]|jgi:3-oxoacyl-[acyl-carrier protein] reductase
MTAGNPLTNKVALITGASGGIGQAIARRLAASGASVALAYNAHAKPAQKLADELVDSGASALAVAADLSRPEAPAELLAEIEPQLGAIDVLVPAAGLGRVQRFEDVSLEDFDEMIAVNLRAPFLLAQRTLPGMAARGFGRVLFVSSVAGFTGGVVAPHYAASKAGLHGLTHFLARRVASDGVTVNAIAPALITDTMMLPGDPEELRSRVPVGRLGKPDEVADLAMAILRNGYITSQVVSVDGGMYPH